MAPRTAPASIGPCPLSPPYLFAQVKASFLNTTLHGATGPISFADNLDRDTAGISLALQNFIVDPASSKPGGLALPSVGTMMAGIGLAFTAPIIWRNGAITDPQKPDYLDTVPLDLTTVPLQCEPGYVSDVSSAGTQICSQCEAGKYEIERKLCMPTNSLTYVPTAGADEAGVVACPAGRRVLELLAEGNGQLGVRMQSRQSATAESECLCEEGSYNLLVLDGNDWSSSSPPICMPCPDGAVCAGGNILPVAKPGYAQLAYSDPSEPPYFFHCKTPEACPGGSITSIMSSPVDREGEVVVTVPYQCADGFLNGSSLCYRNARHSNLGPTDLQIG